MSDNASGNTNNTSGGGSTSDGSSGDGFNGGSNDANISATVGSGNDANDVMVENMRPTKKQRELLSYIEMFIGEHGYSPSYREIMKGLNYTSVATVALHVNNLIKRGHLRKRDRSARSLEVVNPSPANKQFSSNEAMQLGSGSHESWLINRVHDFVKELDSDTAPAQAKLDQLYVLIGALKVLDLHEATQALLPRLEAIQARVES